MVQRIQTVYLLAVSVTSGLFLFFFNPVCKGNVSGERCIYDAISKDGLSILVTILFAASALFSLGAVFLYKRRKMQLSVGRLIILINFFLLGIFVYRSLSLPGESWLSKKGIEGLFPVISIVFMVLANKAVKRDENLVKSADRLR